MPDAPIGVLVMAYGSPRRHEEIEPYYTDIRRGRAPSAEQLAELVRRYDAIGGLSPLNERSDEQLACLAASLEALSPGRYEVAYGTKHARPSIEDGVAELKARGCRSLVGLVLAPHYSALSVGEYLTQAEEAAGRAELPARFIKSWGEDPALVELLAARVTEQLSALSHAKPTAVLFSAHSLPTRILEMGDPYPDELARTAELTAARAGLAHYEIAWQSASRMPEPWLSPSVLDRLEELAKGATKSVLVCPAGFTSDHLEVLYDLDIEARARASALGLSFARTRSLNAEPVLFDALAQRVIAIATP